MSEFIYLFGENALSDIRQERLFAKIRHIIPSMHTLSAQKIYFIQLSQLLSPEQEEKLTSILRTKPQETIQKEQRICIPQLGTQSSWANNALDMFHHCGLPEIIAIEQGIFYNLSLNESQDIASIYPLLHNPLTESLINNPEEAKALFEYSPQKEIQWINLLEEGITALDEFNQEHKLIFTESEKKYLYNYFSGIKRNPSDAEIITFAQTNSEHARHKTFNAHWRINGKKNTQQQSTLSSMIKHTHALFSGNVLSAYTDNAAVISGEYTNTYFYPDHEMHIYQYHSGTYDIVMYVETTPHDFIKLEYSQESAAGVSHEIGSETSVGCGAKPLAGLCGFNVSNLHIPHFIRPWESAPHKSSPLRIMLEVPIGVTSFNNEYGRPQILGYFRTYEDEIYGYDQPTFLIGGLGIIERQQIHKKTVPPQTPLIVLGNRLLWKLNNPEMERRCQEVLSSCFLQGTANPILCINNIATGNLPKALSDLLHHQKIGAHIDLYSQQLNFRGGASEGVYTQYMTKADAARNKTANASKNWSSAQSIQAIPNEDKSALLASLCNKVDGHYILAIEKNKLAIFETIAHRERCPYAVIGHTLENMVLTIEDTQVNARLPSTIHNNDPEIKQKNEFPQKSNYLIDIPLSLLYEHSEEIILEANLPAGKAPSVFDHASYDWKEAAERVLTLPSVASKQFLITIADRSVGGLVAQDPLVGRWQVPVADVGVMATNFKTYSGSAMAIGERPISALFSPKASVRLAITEALFNIAAAPIPKLYDVKLSTNWMADCGNLAQDSSLYEGVYEAGINFCASLSLCIPAANESLSMRKIRENNKQENERIAPLSLVVSAFAPIEDVRKTLTPELCLETPDTRLLLIDLGHKKNRLGGSAFAQVFQNYDGESADVDNIDEVKAVFNLIQTLHHEGKLLAYHDRSDGGLFSCICEMAFASHTGITVQLENLGNDAKAALFSEEPGVVIQVKAEDRDHIYDLAKEHELTECVHIIGRINDQDHIVFREKAHVVLSEDRHTWQKLWQETSSYIKALRDNPECARQEWEMISDKENPGLSAHLTFTHFSPPIPQHLPKIAILREQGTNGHSEMAAAFDTSGFRAVDVHMSDIIEKRITLESFVGLVACGGFSYGDVFGAGRGWANTILLNPYLLNQFQTFFARSDTFALGVSNGCQMLVHLKSIIPGTEHWPIFTRNLSEQFESRLSLVQIEKSPSWLFERMTGSQLPIIVSHGEGRASWENKTSQEQATSFITLRYIDHYGSVTEHYPENPNGSPQGCAGFTSQDGRFNVMMPHPERVFRNIQLSWHPKDWEGEYSPWMEMFMSIRRKY